MFDFYGSAKKNFKTFPVFAFHASIERVKRVERARSEAFQFLLCRIECFYDFSHRDKHLISLVCSILTEEALEEEIGQVVNLIFERE
jgi:hypothetical protein